MNLHYGHEAFSELIIAASNLGILDEITRSRRTGGICDLDSCNELYNIIWMKAIILYGKNIMLLLWRLKIDNTYGVPDENFV